MIIWISIFILVDSSGAPSEFSSTFLAYPKNFCTFNYRSLRSPIHFFSKTSSALHKSSTKPNTMKQAFLFIAVALFACNSSDNKTPESSNTGDTKVASMSTNDLAYPVKDWGDWQPGSIENLKTALQALKDFEIGNVDASMNAFADSIKLAFDGMEGTFSKDSVLKMFSQDRKSLKAMQINMDDYETVKSKDGTQEYVSMWYKQKWQDQKGNWDSVICMDDMKFVNGKIASIDEKRRKFSKNKM
jgi:hypothetical protein